MAQQFIPAADLDFTSYKEKLKTFLQSQSRFSDYDFDGSNLSVLIDLLAVNTFYNGHYLNMVGSEMFLDSSKIREAIVSHAKELNYVPRSRVSSRTTIDVEIIPDDEPTTIVIPKYYRFKTTDNNGQTLYFTTNEDTTALRSNGQYLFSNVEIFEGHIVKDFHIVDSVSTNNDITTYNQQFVLSSPNVDTSSIEVFVKENSNSITSTQFTKAENIYGLTGTSETFFLKGYRDNYYEIEFGDGVFGKPLVNNNLVEIRYRDTRGNLISGNYTFSKTSSVDGYSDIVVSNATRVTSGGERETNESIKYIAPKYYQTQERAVVSSDYSTLVRQAFPIVQDVHAYGGEEVYLYGKVMIVIKPYGKVGVISDLIKNQIIKYLKSKNIVPEPVILDPEYYYLGVEGKVYYNPNLTTQNQNQILSDITTDLVSLNNSTLDSFNITVYQDVITSTIKSADPAIKGCDANLSLIKRWVPTVGAVNELTFTIDNEIVSSLSNTEYSSANYYGVITSRFTSIVNDVVTNVIIQDDGIGNLHLYEMPNATTKTKIGGVIGSVDYTTGKVYVNVDVNTYTNYISFTCVLKNDSVSIDRDKFVIADSTHINLELIS